MSLKSITKPEKGVNALIVCLSVLLCVAFIACMAVGVGFFRVQRIRAAVAQAAQSTAAPRSTLPPTAPDPTPGSDQPAQSPTETAPWATMAPSFRISFLCMSSRRARSGSRLKMLPFS